MTEPSFTDEQIKAALNEVETASAQREAVQAVKGCGSFLFMLIMVLWFLSINCVVGVLCYQAYCQ